MSKGTLTFIMIILMIGMIVFVRAYIKHSKKFNTYIRDLCFDRWCLGYDRQKDDLKMMAFTDMIVFCPYAKQRRCVPGECLVCECYMGWKPMMIKKYGEEKFDEISKESAKQVLSARHTSGKSKRS